MALLDLKVHLAWMVCLEVLDSQATLVTPSLERRVSQETQDKEDFQVSLEARVNEVCLEPLDCLDSLDGRETQVLLVPPLTQLDLPRRATLDCLDWMACPELQEGKERRERQVALDPLVSQGNQVPLVWMDLKVSPETVEIQDSLDLMDNLGERDPEEMMVGLDLMEREESPLLMGQKENPETLVFLDWMACLARQVCLDWMAGRATLEIEDHPTLVLMDPRASPAAVACLVLRVFLDPKDTVANLVSQALMGRRVNLDFQVFLEGMDSQGNLDSRERAEIPVAQVFGVSQEPLVTQAEMVPMVFQALAVPLVLLGTSVSLD